MFETQSITGRTPKPLSKKLNPIWWLQNDDEQQTADWYKPEWPQWRRDCYWNFLRNPLQNCRCYCGWYAFAIVAAVTLLVWPPLLPIALFFIGGVQDRNYSVWGRAPVMTVQRNDLQPPERGFQWCVLAVGPLRLPFVSYSGRRVVWYAGWQPSGFFGAKFNLHRA
jgi:hypothetical protein